MKFRIILLLCLFGVSSLTQAQKFQSDESFVKFFSSAPLEDIEAVNRTARSIIDLGTGDLVYSVKIKDFQFEKSLMQEHFNENYLESDKYPTSTFSGKIKDWDGQKGEQEVTVLGKLLVHGVTREVAITGKINYDGDHIKIDAVFPVLLKNYKVKIPKAVFYNIAEQVEVTVKFEYSKI